jgi:hypothetical protein
MNSLETQVAKNYQQVAMQLPALKDSAYMSRASAEVAAQPKHLHNLMAYARLLMAAKQIDTTGKLYSLQLLHRFIAPEQSPAGSTPGGQEQIIFQSPFKPF